MNQELVSEKGFANLFQILWFRNLIFFVDKMIEMGYDREDIATSLMNSAYDEIYATYMLLGTKEPDVSIIY